MGFHGFESRRKASGQPFDRHDVLRLGAIEELLKRLGDTRLVSQKSAAHTAAAVRITISQTAATARRTDHLPLKECTILAPFSEGKR